MEWQDVCDHQSLQNLPFKIELNARGQLLMSPVKVYHLAFQGSIARLLPLKGVVLPECAIRTTAGTKVADVAWASEERFGIIKDEVECSIAPEICIEVLSASNTGDEINEKVELYIAAGAQEVWVCNAVGQMSFFDKQGTLKKSLLVPAFPSKVRILH